MRKNSKIYVSLTGGLGNQLFQLSAGLACSQSQDVILVTSFGKPRRSNNKPADILEFETGLELETRQATWLVRKAAGYVLRMSASPRSYESNSFFGSVVKNLAGIVLSLHLKRAVGIQSPKGVGFHQFPTFEGPTVMLGYFQSYKWAGQTEIKKRLLNLALQEPNLLMNQFKHLSKVEMPLVVHIRRGDYLNEKSFGVLSEEYYVKAIRAQLSTERYNSIWLFSDDLDLARELIPSDVGLPVREVCEFDHSPASTLQAMRLGYGYVIANSSFSWWAAYLTENDGAQVIAPKPWFHSIPEPQDLIPPSWKRVNSSWEAVRG